MEDESGIGKDGANGQIREVEGKEEDGDIRKYFL